MHFRRDYQLITGAPAAGDMDMLLSQTKIPPLKIENYPTDLAHSTTDGPLD